MGNASYENESDRHVPGEKSEKYRYTELDENLFGIGKINHELLPTRQWFVDICT